MQIRFTVGFFGCVRVQVPTDQEIVGVYGKLKYRLSQFIKETYIGISTSVRWDIDSYNNQVISPTQHAFADLNTHTSIIINRPLYTFNIITYSDQDSS